jgi:hypothetical protein
VIILSEITKKRYFARYQGGRCIAKMACNLLEMVDRWGKEPHVKEIAKEEYDKLELPTLKQLI